MRPDPIALYLCDFIDHNLDDGPESLKECWCQALRRTWKNHQCDCRCHIDRNHRSA